MVDCSVDYFPGTQSVRVAGLPLEGWIPSRGMIDQCVIQRVAGAFGDSGAVDGWCLVSGLSPSFALITLSRGPDTGGVLNF